MPYVSGAAIASEGAGNTEEEEHGEGCVFCTLLSSDEPEDSTYVLRRGTTAAALMNAYPYASGHLMVMPIRHVGELSDLAAKESQELWALLIDAVAALHGAYAPDGINVGANLGRAAGAGIPGHLHLHAVPRWLGDTNFMTSIAETRVLPESLSVSWTRLRQAWPPARD